MENDVILRSKESYGESPSAGEPLSVANRQQPVGRITGAIREIAMWETERGTTARERAGSRLGDLRR